MRRLTGTSAVDLYNAACLFAVATANPHLPRDERLVNASVAWQLLGRALLTGGVAGPWELALTDVELEALDAEQRKLFCDGLKRRHPFLTPLSDDDNRSHVDDAMRSIGIEPPVIAS
jgi:hypothetical protein